MKLPRIKINPKNELAGKQQATVGANKTPMRFKRVYVFAGLVVLVVIVIFGLYKAWALNPINISCTNDTKLINEYNSTMKQQGVTKLQPIQKKVTRKRNYTKDATCMYIVMVSQYGSSDTKGEINSLERLKKLESQGKTVSKKIDTSTVNRGVLEKYIQRLKDEQGKTFNGAG